MLGLAPAPELNRPGLRWFNVDRPLSLSELRGRLVILDFWTACCVNCLHVQPVLRRIQQTFSDQVAVIGINSPKYPAERHTASVAHALERHDIRHPVIHDPDLILWRDYGISAWPTLVFIDPRGSILGDLPGEPAADRLIAGIGEMLRRWRGEHTAPSSPLPIARAARPSGRFRFPAKIKPLPRNGRKHWAVADSGHHQIVLCDDAGREVRRFGCGAPGFVDLDADCSAFNSPQGLACDTCSIYVADTGNHAIRRIDLATGCVQTLAGTGERGPPLADAARGRDVDLASVWDLEVLGSRLFFANAGTHQLGHLDMDSGVVTPLAGDGSEDLRDGIPPQARLAQPTGLALDVRRGELYFVDSETSSVRVVGIGPDARVETLVGAGLYECGRRNGEFETARLQHCRGVAWWNGRLVVADSYNGVLRVLDLRTRWVSDLAGDDCAWANGAQLVDGECAGVAVDGDNRLLVADTNHDRLVEVTLSRSAAARVWAA